MSQRYLVPTNLFYHWQDPWPPEFPTPNTGDVYFNVSSRSLRVFYEGSWNDAGGSGSGGAGAGGNEVVVQDAEPLDTSLELWVDTDAEGFSLDHGDLTGLGDDDHPQYLTPARADAQYVRASELVVSSSPPSGTPAGGIGTVWIQW